MNTDTGKNLNGPPEQRPNKNVTVQHPTQPTVWLHPQNTLETAKPKKPRPDQRLARMRVREGVPPGGTWKDPGHRTLWIFTEALPISWQDSVITVQNTGSGTGLRAWDRPPPSPTP